MECKTTGAVHRIASVKKTMYGLLMTRRLLLGLSGRLRKSNPEVLMISRQPDKNQFQLGCQHALD